MANLTLSLLVSMLIVSDKFANSLHVLAKSADGKVTIELYSVSGIPNYSESSWSKFKLNSENLSFLCPSKVNLMVEGSSSA